MPGTWGFRRGFRIESVAPPGTRAASSRLPAPSPTVLRRPRTSTSTSGRWSTSGSAWALLARPRYTRALALVVAVLEIGIAVTKFVLFLGAPEWTIRTTNWFVNKLFVLGCFVLMPGRLLARRQDHAPRVAAA